MREFRKHASWYTKGFRGSAQLRHSLMSVSSDLELESVLHALDGGERFPPTAMRVPRGKSGGTQVVSLPEGYLDHLDDATPPEPEAEDDEVSGG